MDALMQPDEIERRAKVVGVSAAKLCKMAKVHRATFWRWKQGNQTPSIATYQRLIDALCSVEMTAE
jgi:predicted transcriptional regulator